jgi:Glycosyltransferase family 87
MTAARAIATWLTPPRRRALRDGLILAGLLLDVAIYVVGITERHTVGADAYAYWIVNLDHPYSMPIGAIGAFPYSPVVARLFAPASLLSWPVFWWLWMAVLVATVIWLGGSKVLWLLAFPPVAVELYYGNINLLIAAAIALGFRYPVTWAFVLLAKVTPGVGLIWFAVRREWRSFGIALGVAGVIAVVSLIVDGRLWVEWASILTNTHPPAGQSIEIPLAVRVPVAAVIVAWGARTDRRWTVPVAACMSLPVLWIATFGSVLAALPAIYRPELRARAESAAGLR